MRGGRGGAVRGRRGRRTGRRASPIAAVGLVVLAGAGAAPLEAQDDAVLPPPSVGVVGGLFQRIDYHGEGASELFGLRVRFPLGRHALVEPGAHHTSFLRDPEPESGADPELRLLILDFQLQAQLPVTLNGAERLRPWLGVGAGGAVDFRSNRGTDDFLVSTFTAGVGVALDLGARVTLLAEGRYRTLDEFEHRAVAAVVGLGWKF